MVANADIIIRRKEMVDSERSARDTTEDWDKIFAVNKCGVFLSYKYAARQMIAQGNGGRILGASSIAGRKAGFEASAYCAPKFAVRGLTQSAALELGKYGITVNAYAPGFTKTALSMMKAKYWNDPTSLMRNYGLVMPSYFKLGEPESIFRPLSVCCLLIKASKGQTISPNGGVLFD
ncbi:hypothetical protein DFJ43DRAFT_1044581 [Lentinula guzmanii]|uniref:NAD(P)-binding protein n=1 Tax=Lentinula guzmanii TaxID=2804957 RepID=A0AA38J206_9AGAR|nr:hypothetical protein DFJ43DRAFT_1044581 [Lentinula guzmanii]